VILTIVSSWRMPSSGMLRRVALVRTVVSEECSNSITIFRSLCQLLVTANVVPSSPIFVTLRMEAPSSSEKLVLTRARWRNILEDCIIYSHRRENFKSYMVLPGWAPWRRRNVFRVRYELDFYVPEDYFFIATAVEISNLTSNYIFK
jgi:hypothetical protein